MLTDRRRSDWYTISSPMSLRLRWAKKMTLGCFHISGHPLNRKEFQNRLVNSFSNPRESQPKINITRTSQKWFSFCGQSVSPFLPGINNVQKFLSELYSKGLQYRSGHGVQIWARLDLQSAHSWKFAEIWILINMMNSQDSWKTCFWKDQPCPDTLRHGLQIVYSNSWRIHRIKHCCNYHVNCQCYSCYYQHRDV